MCLMKGGNETCQRVVDTLKTEAAGNDSSPPFDAPAGRRSRGPWCRRRPGRRRDVAACGPCTESKPPGLCAPQRPRETSSYPPPGSGRLPRVRSFCFSTRRHRSSAIRAGISTRNRDRRARLRRPTQTTHVVAAPRTMAARSQTGRRSDSTAARHRRSPARRHQATALSICHPRVHHDSVAPSHFSARSPVRLPLPKNPTPQRREKVLPVPRGAHQVDNLTPRRPRPHDGRKLC